MRPTHCGGLVSLDSRCWSDMMATCSQPEIIVREETEADGTAGGAARDPFVFRRSSRTELRPPVRYSERNVMSVSRRALAYNTRSPSFDRRWPFVVSNPHRQQPLFSLPPRAQRTRWSDPGPSLSRTAAGVLRFLGSTAGSAGLRSATVRHPR